ncbi:helix-turn-helix domain-containing protein [Rhodoferax sp. U11-2br]|uniref:helix-turn-helix domain-containing protein n=1 Tax=Rhodoferax sp. U11-2br TaxID=2838878 RepID=UPI001BECF312|nr:helix-turn-helix domain-containing protein [Rhodoferax sp. U11-2br]MBT3067379.1 helix-turn-helix domain-containing protein [Rhodoferax sp. U11-2br]
MQVNPARFDGVSSGVRRYNGEYQSHAHDHVQIMFGLQGRMELDVAGHSAFADASCGLLIPAGVSHGFLAGPDTRMFVIELPAQEDLGRARSFAVTAACRESVVWGDARVQLAQVLQAPRILARRGIDLAQLDAALTKALFESWSTQRMAALFFLSPQRFHARLLELTGQTPQDYLRRLRLDAAERLLRLGLALETAALQVGYRSASALSYALKRDRQLGARVLRQA